MADFTQLCRCEPRKPWCWILSLWQPVLSKNTVRELSSSFVLKALQ